ncbi:MAG TPA: hypothetical protein VLV56_18480 [Burkholderiales bacterium]|nr:hypothetical protein [Burkholderiales bacterium]
MRRSLAAGTILLASSAALAQQPDPLATRGGWELGAQASRYDYLEPDFAELKGNRIGIVAAYTWTGDSGLFGKLDYRESYGRLKYEGSGTMDKVPDLIFELRALAGLDWVGSSVSLSPYAGLGYRYLYDDLRGTTSTGASGYRRNSNYLYSPVGLTARWHMGGGWVLAPTAEADVFLYGTQVTKLSDASSALMDVTNHQGSGRGHRFSLMIEKGQWAFGGWNHYWHIKDSDTLCFTPVVNNVCLAGQEPENYTREYGLELRYRF